MRSFLSLILLMISVSSFAQKQGNIWHFGIRAGLDFSSGVPVVIPNGMTGTNLALGSNQEGTASISDSSGRLLFYTSGETIWNNQHNIMPNGSGILGGTSSTQSSIIVPMPGSNNLFYVFTSDAFQNYSSPWTPRGYRYTVVDMCKDNGRGDVLVAQKNILLIDSSTEKLAVCEDNSGNGYWIMGHKMFSNEFYAWHLTSSGISAPVVSPTGTIHGKVNSTLPNWNSGSAQGQMKINLQGTKLALAIGNYDPATIDLFDFDKNTGTVSNFCHMGIDSLLFKRSYGLEFSPDGSKLYVGVGGGVGGVRLYQYDITAGDCNAVISSQVQVFLSGPAAGIASMQTGPDKKIYMACNGATNLGRINFPDLAGVACDFDLTALNIAPGSNANYSLPAFIAGYKYHNKLTSTIDIGNDIHVCVNDTAYIHAPAGFQTYAWQPVNEIHGLGSDVYVVPQNDITVSIIATKDGCIAKDTIEVKVLNSGKLDLGNDLDICKGDVQVITAPPGFISYEWNTGSHNQQIQVSGKGMYWVKAMDMTGCYRDTIEIKNVYDLPVPNLGPDFKLCQSQTKMIEPGDYSSYLWNDNSTGRYLSIKDTGIYKVLVTDKNNCKASDDIHVTGCEQTLYLPNSFTPNMDSKNDVFKAITFAGAPKKFGLYVYNKYGQLVFYSTDITKGWDGTLNGKLQPTSGYVWRCIYQFDGQVLNDETGTVILIR